MGNLNIILALMLTLNMVNAQKRDTKLFSIPLSHPEKPGKLVVDQLSGSIKVVAYMGNHVVIEVISYMDEDGEVVDSNKKGTRMVSIPSTNIGIGEKNNVVEIHNVQMNRKTDLSIKVPHDFSLKLNTVNDGDITVEGINGEMEVSNFNGGITLDNVAGSASADTTNGNVTVKFTSITEGADMAFSSFNGNVEIVFPRTLRANVKARSDMGNVYTDFDIVILDDLHEIDINSSQKSYGAKNGHWIKGKINGGGPEMLFKTFRGDIIIKSE